MLHHALLLLACFESSDPTWIELAAPPAKALRACFAVGTHAETLPGIVLLLGSGDDAATIEAEVRALTAGSIAGRSVLALDARDLDSASLETMLGKAAAQVSRSQRAIFAARDDADVALDLLLAKRLDLVRAVALRDPKSEGTEERLAALKASLPIPIEFENAGPDAKRGDLAPLLDRACRSLAAHDALIEAANRALDDFHDAAAQADFERYFRHFAPDGVFLGTDASERWTVPQFREYVEPYFSKGRGWTYTPLARSVDLDLRLQGNEPLIAWFDERLTNAKYGECRGSGVLRRVGEHWKIVQYNLTFTVPNDVAGKVVDLIRAG